MKKHANIFIFGLLFLIACCFQINAQNAKDIYSVKIAFTEEFIHEARELYDWNKIEKELSKRLHINQADCNNFFRYIYKNKLADFTDYLSKVKDGSITKANADQYWFDQFTFFEKLYHQERKSIAARSVLSTSSMSAPSACNNLDFTSGTTGWTAKWNDLYNKNHYKTNPLNLPTTGFNSSGGANATDYVHELVTAGWDPYVPISKVPPGHTSALRLGDDEAMYLSGAPFPYNHQMVRNTFRVSATNPTITYWYAVVFSQATVSPTTGPHGQKDQPYFRIRLFDKNGDTIKCASYDVDITKGISGGFKVKEINDDVEVVYKDWVPIYIPLINHINEDVTIQFESSDCNAGGHVGYAYVAVDCAPFEVITTSPYICGSNTIQLTAPGGASTYLWSGPGVVPPSDVQTITANAPGRYKVTMTVVGNEGVTCTFELDTVIKGNSKLPVALFSNTIVCPGDPTIFKDESTPLGTITEWAWDFNNDGIIDSHSQNPSYTFSGAGTFPVKLTIKQGPCDATITKNIVVEPLPVLKITNPPPVCLPNKVDITLSSVTAGSTAGTLTYWTNSSATVPLTNPEAVGIAGTYYIKVKTAAGCTDIKPVVVTMNPGAVLVITNPPAVCSPATVDITTPAITTGSSPGTLSYWTNEDATTSLSNPNAITVSGTYYIKSTPSTGCIDIKPVVVTINPKPTLVITDPPAVCLPSTVDITAATITAGSTTGGTLSYWANSTATTPLTMAPDVITVSGTYYIKIVVAGGCEDIKPVNVVVNPLPVSNAGPDVIICTGDVASLGSAPVSIYSYQWSPQDGLSSGIIANPTVTLTNTGKTPISTTYVVTTINTLTGCTTTDTVKVTVNSVPTVNAGSATSVCPGSIVDLLGTIGGSATSATWTGGNGAFGNRNELKTTYKPTQAEFDAGTITLTLRSNDPEGPCTFASSDVILTFYKNPTVKYSVDKNAGCPVHCVSFKDSSIVDATGDYIEQWSWNFGDPTSLANNTSNLQNPKHCYANPGFYDVTLTVTSNHGCVSRLDAPKMIQVYAIPVAEFYPTPNPVSVLNPKVTLVNGSSEDVIFWNYHFGDGDSISPNTPSPVHIYPEVASTSYTATLHVKNKDGCINSIQHIIEVGPEFTFYIPNAFTPDGDGINDFFFGTGIGIVQYDLTIFDRWGNLIFHSDNLAYQWNGKANNGDEIAQQDVFVWKVKLTDVFGKKHNYIGTVTLVK